jgi:hypothetical protein
VISRFSGAFGLARALLLAMQQGDYMMRKVASVLAIAGLLALGACNKSNADKAADNVRAAAENTADNIEAAASNTASNLENRADAVTDAADNRADAVRNAAENKADRIESNSH